MQHETSIPSPSPALRGYAAASPTTPRAGRFTDFACANCCGSTSFTTDSLSPTLVIILPRLLLAHRLRRTVFSAASAPQTLTPRDSSSVTTNAELHTPRRDANSPLTLLSPRDKIHFALRSREVGVSPGEALAMNSSVAFSSQRLLHNPRLHLPPPRAEVGSLDLYSTRTWMSTKMGGTKGVTSVTATNERLTSTEQPWRDFRFQQTRRP